MSGAPGSSSPRSDARSLSLSTRSPGRDRPDREGRTGAAAGPGSAERPDARVSKADRHRAGRRQVDAHGSANAALRSRPRVPCRKRRRGSPPSSTNCSPSRVDGTTTRSIASRSSSSGRGAARGDRRPVSFGPVHYQARRRKSWISRSRRILLEIDPSGLTQHLSWRFGIKCGRRV